MKLIDHTPESLADYVTAQVANLVPDGRHQALREAVGRHQDEALSRIITCIDARLSR